MSNLYEETSQAELSCYKEFLASGLENRQRGFSAGSLREEIDADRLFPRRVKTKFNVIGVRTDAMQTEQVIEQMQRWIGESNGCHSIADQYHGIVEAQHDASFKEC